MKAVIERTGQDQGARLMYHRHKQAMPAHRRCSDALSRPEKEHNRRSRPRPSPAPPSGPFEVRRQRRPRRSADRPRGCTWCSRLSSRRTWPGRRAQVGKAPSSPERGGGICSWMVSRCVSGRSLVWMGRGVLWASVLLMSGGTGGVKTRRDQGRCPLAWRDPWRAATPSQTHSSRQKTPLVLPRTLSGERRRGRCFAQPLEPGPLPNMVAVVCTLL